MSKIAFSFVLGLLTLAAPAYAHDYRAGDLFIDHPWARAMPPQAKVAGGFLAIRNDGEAPDRLVAVATERAGKTELHLTSIEDGVMRMRPVEGGIEIAPGETVTFEPGGLHVMFLEIEKPFAEGERVSAVLQFEQSGEVTVEFAVGPAGSSEHHHEEHQ